MTSRSLLFLSFSLIFFSLNSTANTFPEDTLRKLSEDPQWLHLLHYHQVGMFSSFESQVDDTAFFLSESGKTDPLAELKSTIDAFQENKVSDDSPICRFPARFDWLNAALDLSDIPKPSCDKFQAWFSKIDAKNLTLVFPAAYLNSPSSMFGHTFIRIDRHSGSNSLLDFSVNYAANADPDDNELVFSYKGLSGGYPGVFSILPYYQKVKEYSFLESRDVWEYRLDLTQEEVKQFIRHIWEIQNAHFDYYFFTENCSYHLLTILDAASPRFNFSDQFYLSVMPADTVRIIEQSQLVKHAEFRPSTMSLMNHMLSQIDDTLQDKAKTLVDTNADIQQTLNSLNSTEKSQTLELAYQYSRYLSVRKKQQIDGQAKRAIALLSARSKLANKEVYDKYPTPEYRDDQGHHSRRLETSAGYDGSNYFSQVGLRMAYHDRLDTVPGYIRGAKLEMFHAKFRHTFYDNSDSPFSGKNDETRLQEFRFIDIASFSPRNDFITPTSWHVSTGFKRPNSAPNELTAFLTTGAGHSYLTGTQQFYALLDAEFDADNDIEDGYRLAAGPHIGWLTQHETWSANLEYTKLFDLFGADFKEQSALLGLSVSLNKDWQLRVESEYSEHKVNHTKSQKTQYSNTLSLMHYF